MGSPWHAGRLLAGWAHRSGAAWDGTCASPLDEAPPPCRLSLAFAACCFIDGCCLSSAAVDVSLTTETCCIKVFPAVVALAKNFKGHCHFARILADESAEANAMLQ